MMALGHIITAVNSNENRFLSLLVMRDREAEVLTASLSTELIQTSASLSLSLMDNLQYTPNSWVFMNNSWLPT